MWVGVGIVLGLVVVATVFGFHLGPHGHAAGAVLGVVAAVWLLVMAATGDTRPLVWVLLGADVALSAGLGALAWQGLRASGTSPAGSALPSLLGAEGEAVSALEPEGIVRVRGEQWSAVAVNGPVPAGTRVQVIDASGVRLSVWAERDDAVGGVDGLTPGQHPMVNPAGEGEKEEAR